MKLLSEQNFVAAVIAGAIATALAAVAFGAIVSMWSFAYGFAAAGVGILIGLSMGLTGRGISTKFAVGAAMYTIIGCVLGNLSWVVINLAQATSASPFDVLRDNPFTELVNEALTRGFSIYLVYWFIAIIAAVFLSRRSLSRADRFAIRSLESDR